MLYYLLLFSFISILIWIRVIAKFLNPGFHILHRSTYGNSTRTSVPLEKAFVEQKSSKGALGVEKGRVPSFSSHRVSVKTVTRSHYNCNSMPYRILYAPHFIELGQVHYTIYISFHVCGTRRRYRAASAT